MYRPSGLALLPCLAGALLLAGGDLAARAPIGREPGREPAAAGPVAGPASVRACALARLDSLFRADERDALDAALTAGLGEARAAADTAYLLPLLIRKGRAAASWGGGAGCEADLREAVELAEARGDTAQLAAAVRWLGVAVENQGRAAEARRLYGRALVLAAAAGDRATEGWCHIGFGWHEHLAGRSLDASDHYRRAQALLEAEGDLRGLAWACNGLGVCLVKLGHDQEALACFRRAAELAERTGFAFVQGLALNNQAGLELGLGDPGRAQATFQAALALQRRQGHRREMVPPALNVALCLTQLGRYQAAADSLAAVLQLCLEEGFADLVATSRIDLAEVALLRGRPAHAARLLREVLAAREPLSWWQEVEARVALSRALAARDSAAAGLAALHAFDDARCGTAGAAGPPALELERGRLLLALGEPEKALQRLAAVAATAARSGTGTHQVGALAAGGRAWGELGRPDSALCWLERAAAAWERERSAPLDPEWREARGARGRLVATELADLLLRDGASPASVFERLQLFKARTLRERIHGPGTRDGAEEAGPGLPVLQAQVLGPGELLLDAHLGPRISLLFAVTRDECRVARWPGSAELGRRLESLAALASRPPDPGREGARAAEACREAARALRERLFADVEDLLAASPRVVFCPDGETNLLPVALLADEGSHWTRAPSAALLADLRLAAPTAAAADDDLRVLAVCGAAADPDQRLVGAGREVAALGLRYRAVELEQVGSPGAAARLRQRDVLHFAAHARIDDDAPWESSLALGAAGERLTAGAIAGERLAARLVVLSGCSSADGRALPGEGVQGLATGFLAAGVPAVLATLWPVDDEATGRLVAVFYRELARGRTAAAALAAGQADLRRADATAHPFYWAPFVLVGDGEIRVPLRERPWTPARLLLDPLAPRRSQAAGGAVLLAGLAAGVVAGGRRRRAGASAEPGCDYGDPEASLPERAGDSTGDEELLRLALEARDREEGRRAAWLLLGRHRRQVYLWCHRIVRDHERALDLSQDVLLLAHRRLDTFAGRASFASWLFAVTRNRCLSELRRPVLIDGEADPDQLPDGGRDPEQQLLESLREQELLALLRERLDPLERRALWLRCFERMPIPAITEILQVGELSGARAVLQRARRKLRAALSERGEA